MICSFFLTACSLLSTGDEAEAEVQHSKSALQEPSFGSDMAHVTPTLDFPHPIPTPRQQAVEIIVQQGDTLKNIARRYQVSFQQLAQVNQIRDPNLLAVGQRLIVPPPQPEGDAPEFKIIPDSELVYGPKAISFKAEQFIQTQLRYLAPYKEEVDGETLTAAAIVERVAREHSVNPRLLLAVIEYQKEWRNNPQPSLWRQLNGAANELNRGYYLWKANAASFWVLRDGTVIAVSPYVNAGTAAVQQLFAELADRQEWFHAVSEAGLAAAYQKLFGNPFAFALEPLIPDDVQQPDLQLPFEKGVKWYFTGGPHNAWGSGSAWAALDFAPFLEVLGCTPSQEWVVAAADGQIVYADRGLVIQDLDGDGHWQTGWSLLYLHVESRDRVAAGTLLKAGQRIGHPSCEGGVSNGTHVHLARRYNGEWIAADGAMPFNLDGWVSAGKGDLYQGTLTKENTVIVAEDQAAAENMLYR